MINLKQFKQELPDCENPEMLHEVFRIYEKQKTLRLLHPQKVILEKAHKYLELGSINKSCGSCIAHAVKKMSRIFAERFPKKKVKQIDQQLKKSVEDFPTNYMALKSFAEKRLNKKYPKGTKSITILKDLKA